MKLENKIKDTLSIIRHSFPEHYSRVRQLLMSDDQRNIDLGLQLSKSLCQSIKNDKAKIWKIVINQGWYHQRFAIIRELFTESQIPTIREMIDGRIKKSKKPRYHKHEYFFLEGRVIEKVYQNIANQIAGFYNDNRAAEYWRGAKFTHTRDISKFELKLGHHNFATIGNTVYHFTFNFYAYNFDDVRIKIPKLDYENHVILMTPKSWDKTSPTIAFCIIPEYYPWHGKKVIHKGILEDGVFHKKNLTAIKRLYLEALNLKK